MKHIHIPETNITIPRIAASFAPAGSDYTDTHNYYLVDAYLELGGTFLMYTVGGLNKDFR